MKSTFKFLLALVLALLVAWAIRTYAFTVFSVPDNGLSPELKSGNRVIVNRIECDSFSLEDNVVFTDSTHYYIGKIINLPGDTISLKGNKYVIPTICCKRCKCKDCRYYLVHISRGKILVHKHQIIGKAHKLF